MNGEENQRARTLRRTCYGLVSIERKLDDKIDEIVLPFSLVNGRFFGDLQALCKKAPAFSSRSATIQRCTNKHVCMQASTPLCTLAHAVCRLAA